MEISNVHDAQCYTKEWRQSFFLRYIGSLDIFWKKQTPRFACLTKELIEFIQNLCLELELPNEIEFAAYDTIDQYYSKLYKKTGNKFTTTTIENNNNERISFYKTQVSQNTMTILLVLSLCSKYIGNSKSQRNIENVQIIRDLMMADTSQLFLQATTVDHLPIKSIIEKEFEIYKVLEYKIEMCVSLTVIEICIGIGTTVFPKLNKDLMRKITTQILRVCYLERKLIENEIQQYNKNEISKININDDILMAASVTYTSLCIFELPEHDCKRFLYALAAENRRQVIHTQILSKVIFNIVLN